MEQVLLEFGKMVPVVAVLWFFINFFIKELRMKNEEIKELNTLLRTQNENMIKAVTSMTTAVQELTKLIEKKL